MWHLKNIGCNIDDRYNKHWVPRNEKKKDHIKHKMNLQNTWFCSKKLYHVWSIKL